jgi:hypothetical protein
VAPLHSLVTASHRGSFVPEGTRQAIWRHHSDLFATREIYAHVGAVGSTVNYNATLESFVEADTPLSAMGAGWFAPLPFRAVWAGEALPVRALQTGSRTFAILGEAAEALAFPKQALLDLGKAAWGEGTLELKPEIKGSGTQFSRTKLTRPSRAALEKLLPAGVPVSWIDAFEADPDPLFVSLNTYEGRPLGGQDARLSDHALHISEALVGSSPVKLAPTLAHVTCPPEYQEWLVSITQALSPDPRHKRAYGGELSIEIRLTPGHLRAAYFDTAKEPGLVELCNLLSTSPDGLEKTYNRMVADAGRYLDELCEKTGYRTDLDCFTWPKFGDIHVVFRRDRFGYPTFADEYKFAKSAAWYIAKDQVVVSEVGLVHVDLESVTQAFPSVNEEELRWHHDLYVLNVLRDHVRVIGKFDYGRRLAARETTTPDGRERVQALQRALHALARASQNSPCYRVELGPHGLTVDLHYALLGTASHHRYPLRLLGDDLALG